jgi:hypothetical protein
MCLYPYPQTLDEEEISFCFILAVSNSHINIGAIPRAGPAR